MKEFWDSRYGEAEYIYGTAPNAFFADFFDGKTPGRLLLPGEGEGRNAVHAARLGWKVDAVDYSAVAREKALRLARQHEVAINYQVENLLTWQPPACHYDLVALIYVHLASIERKQFHARVAGALAKGGTLLLEAFSKEQLGNTSGGPKDPDMLFSLEELAGDFQGLKVMSLEKKETILAEGEFHAGKANVLRLVARRD